MSNFSNIDEVVKQQLAAQAPAAPPIEPTNENAERVIQNHVAPSELEQTREELAALKAERESERLAHEESLRILRLERAAAIAHKPLPTVRSNAQQDIAFDELRRKVGGNCFLGNLTPAQKLESIGISGTEQIKDAEVKTYFGKGSDGAKSNALSRADPERYSLLRVVAIARNLY